MSNKTLLSALAVLQTWWRTRANTCAQSLWVPSKKQDLRTDANALVITCLQNLQSLTWTTYWAAFSGSIV